MLVCFPTLTKPLLRQVKKFFKSRNAPAAAGAAAAAADVRRQLTSARPPPPQPPAPPPLTAGDLQNVLSPGEEKVECSELRVPGSILGLSKHVTFVSLGSCFAKFRYRTIRLFLPVLTHSVINLEHQSRMFR